MERIGSFGYGNFGSVWASDIEGHPDSVLEFVSDPRFNEVENLTDEVPGEPEISDQDFSQAVEVSSRNGKPRNYEILDENLIARIEDLDQAVVATSTDSHFELGLVLSEAEIDIMLEKPPTESPEETELLLEALEENDVKAGVNMIERQHPAYKAAKDVFDDEIGHIFNYRSKDLRGKDRGLGGGEGSRIIMEDLIHDLSEIEGLTEQSLTDSTVENADVNRWNEIGDFDYRTDVDAEVVIRYDDGPEAELRGSFADEERRYFVAVNREKDRAFYVNTLSRDHISPQAAIIEGEDNIEYLEEVARNGMILDDEAQRVLMEKVDAETLEEEMEKHVPDSKYVDEKPMFGWAPVYNQVENMTSDAEPVTDLEEVYGYQKIIQEIYEASGKSDATSPELS